MRLLDFDSGWLYFEEVFYVYRLDKIAQCIGLQIDIVCILCTRKKKSGSDFKETILPETIFAIPCSFS